MSRVFVFRYAPPALVAISLASCLVGCGGGTGGTGGAGGMAPGTGGSGNTHLAQFSFFVVSKEAVVALSGSQDGFGGDLRFGQSTGLAGADKICASAAEMGLVGAGAKSWRAFLSASTGGPGGGATNAKDRVGSGPWHDASGRLVASTLDQLLMNRPGDADAAIKNDLPNETGLPNHMDGAPGCTGSTCPDNHQILTGSGADGALYTATTPVTDATCDDWTSKAASGHPRMGHSWPRQGSGTNWISDEDGAGCAPCTSATPSTACVGATGSYGGFYCFALVGG
jgi:hypothetical protein